MKVKALVWSLFLATVFLGSLSAFDWGGTVDNSTSTTYVETDQWLQEDKLALWLSTPIGTTLELTAEGSYTFSYTQPDQMEHILDIDLLHLGGVVPGRNNSAQLRFLVGRFPSSDMTTLILDDRVDGLEVGWITADANTTLLIGYTGLQWEQVSTVSITQADNTDSDDLAPPRLIGSIQIQFPELLFRQDLFVSMLFQQDLRSEGANFSIDGTGGILRSQYIGLGIGGPIVSSLYHETYVYLGTGTAPSDISGVPGYAPIRSFFGVFTLRYFVEELLNSKAELRFVFTSGDDDFTTVPNGYYEGNTVDNAGVFVPISRKQLAVAFSPRLGNLVLLDAGYSLKPANSLQALLKAIVFFRPTSGPIMDARTIDSDSKYLGTEIDGVVNFRPLSDLGGSLALGLFLPMGGAFADQDVLFKGQLEISFSF